VINGQAVVENVPYPDEGTTTCPTQKSNACPTTCNSNATPPNNVYSTDKYSFSGGITVQPNNAATIQNAIYAQGPLEVAFTVYQDFENYTCGIYKHTYGSSLGGHAVKITGWGVENGVAYWKVANSWNPYWGEEGFFRILRGVNECGIESQATSSSATAVWKTPTGSFSSPIKVPIAKA
jgi:cathepsin B